MTRPDGPIRRGAGTPFGSPRWRDVEPIFELALVLPPDERAAYLEGATFGDADLRREIERLLAAAAAQRAAKVTPPATPVAWDAATAPSLVGQQLSPYWLDLELSRSQDSVAYIGTRVDPFIEPGDTASRRVVVRVAHRPLASEHGAQRLRERRDQLAAVVHPSVTRLLDAATTADGRPYVVSEFAYGTPVMLAAADGSLDMNSRLSLFLQVADAVTHLHGAGIAHGALRASTLLVDSVRTLKVVDAGLSSVLAPHTDGSSATERGDVRALGAVLFELLSDAPAPAGSATPLMSASTRGVARVWERRLRGDLDAVVAAALHPDDAAGYQTVAAFAADVRRFVAGHPVSVRATGPLHRARLFVVRNAAFVFVGVVLAMIAAGGAWVASRRTAADTSATAPAERTFAAAPATVAPETSELVTAPIVTPPTGAAPAAVAPIVSPPVAPAPVAAAATDSTRAVAAPVAAAPSVTPPAVAAPVVAARIAATPIARERTTIPGARARRRVVSDLASLDSMSPGEQGSATVRRRYAIAFSRLATLQSAAGDDRDALSSSRRAYALWQAIADSDPTDAQALAAMETEVQRIRRLTPRTP